MDTYSIPQTVLVCNRIVFLCKIAQGAGDLTDRRVLFPRGNAVSIPSFSLCKICPRQGATEKARRRRSYRSSSSFSEGQRRIRPKLFFVQNLSETRRNREKQGAGDLTDRQAAFRGATPYRANFAKEKRKIPPSRVHPNSLKLHFTKIHQSAGSLVNTGVSAFLFFTRFHGIS